jgi:hypothetical protein
MFINTKKSIKIIADNGTKFEARAGWIGEVPQWVENHWYFKALCKDGSVTAIVKSGATPVTPPTNDPPKQPDGNPADAELAALRARAAELKVPRSSQLGKDRLIAAIAEAEAKANTPQGDKPDLLADMDAPALRQFAASNEIDLAGIADDATADELRQAIKDAQTED